MKNPLRRETLLTLRGGVAKIFSQTDPLSMREVLHAADLLPDSLQERDTLPLRLTELERSLDMNPKHPEELRRALEAVLAIAPDNHLALTAMAGAAQEVLEPPLVEEMRRRHAFAWRGLLEAPRNVRCSQLAPLPDGGFAAADAEHPRVYIFDAQGVFSRSVDVPVTQASGLARVDAATMALIDPRQRACLFLTPDFKLRQRLEFSRWDGPTGEQWTPYRLCATAEAFYLLVRSSRERRFRIATLEARQGRPHGGLRPLDLPEITMPLDLAVHRNRLWVVNLYPGLLYAYALGEGGTKPRLERVACVQPRLRCAAPDGDEIFLASDEALLKLDAGGHVFAKYLDTFSHAGKATVTSMLLTRQLSRRVLYCCDKTLRGIHRIEIDPDGPPSGF